MDDMDITALVFVIIALLIVWNMYREHLSGDTPYRLSDLYTTGEHMDADKTWKLVAVFIMSFIVVHAEMNGRTADWLIMAFLALTGGFALAGRIMKMRNEPQQPGTITTTVKKESEISKEVTESPAPKIR